MRWLCNYKRTIALPESTLVIKSQCFNWDCWFFFSFGKRFWIPVRLAVHLLAWFFFCVTSSSLNCRINITFSMQSQRDGAHIFATLQHQHKTNVKYSSGTSSTTQKCNEFSVYNIFTRTAPGAWLTIPRLLIL